MKLKSRKFWLSIAAFLGSLGISISGIVTDNKTIIVIGTICTFLSSAIYCACEAYVDGKAVKK